MLIVKLNDVSIAYEKRGRGMPLVLIHGYPLDHTIWNEIVPLLESNFNVILPDMRGFGQSELGDKDLRMGDYAHDLASLLDALDIQKAFIAGHSMGGYIALNFVTAYSHRVLGMGLVSSQAHSDPAERRKSRYMQAESILANGVTGVAEDMSGKLSADPKIQAVLKALILQQRPKALAAALHAMADRPDSMHELSQFDVPIKIIHGTEDILVPPERAREEHDIVKTSELYEIRGAGHMPMMEKPVLTADALKSFLL